MPLDPSANGILTIPQVKGKQNTGADQYAEASRLWLHTEGGARNRRRYRRTKVNDESKDIVHGVETDYSASRNCGDVVRVAE